MFRYFFFVSKTNNFEGPLHTLKSILNLKTCSSCPWSCFPALSDELRLSIPKANFHGLEQIKGEIYRQLRSLINFSILPNFCRPLIFSKASHLYYNERKLSQYFYTFMFRTLDRTL